jgi:hypothetical protein
MSGAGDTGAGGEVSRDEAVWRDLIARFDLPADPQVAGAPWPVQEDLPIPPQANLDQSAPSRPVDADRSGLADPDRSTADTVIDPVITPDQLGGQQPGSPTARPWTGPGGGYGPADRTRVIRPAGDPRSYTPPDEDEDERYVPAPLPPPGRLDPISKAALLGIIGGPGYLLVASVFLHWTISAPAAFVAVAAFIGGFVTLVVKLGDRPRRDDDDDGAVL